MWHMSTRTNGTPDVRLSSRLLLLAVAALVSGSCADGTAQEKPMQEARNEPMNESKYKELLLEEFSGELLALEPADSAKSNLDWLWNRATSLGADNDEIRAVLCQLAIHFGVSALNAPCVGKILSDTELSTRQRIQALSDCLQN